MTKSAPKPNPFVLFICFSWLAIVGILLLSPGIGIISWLSDIFGGSEVTDAIGHIVLMTVNFLLFYGVLSQYKPAKEAQTIVTVVAIVLGLALELGQLWVPFRSVSWIDLFAVFIGAGIAKFIINMPIHNLIYHLQKVISPVAHPQINK